MAQTPIQALYAARIAEARQRRLAAAAVALAPNAPAARLMPVSFERKFRRAAAVLAERQREYQAVGRRMLPPSTMLCSDAFGGGAVYDVQKCFHEDLSSVNDLSVLWSVVTPSAKTFIILICAFTKNDTGAIRPS